MLSVFIIAGLIYIGVSQNSIAVIAIYLGWPILLMLWVVIGVVCLGTVSYTHLTLPTNREV